MYFQKLDVETWERAPIYRHFIDDLRCVMSLTAEIDVTEFLRALRGRGYRFYPSMIWVVSAAVNCREELRMGRDGNGEIMWKRLQNASVMGRSGNFRAAWKGRPLFFSGKTGMPQAR